MLPPHRPSGDGSPGALQVPPDPARHVAPGGEWAGTEVSRCLRGLLISTLLILLTTGGVLAWVFRNHLSGKNTRRTARDAIADKQRREAGRRKGERGTFEERYQVLRQQILQGNFASAEDGFSELSRRSGLTRPQGDWARFHLILASLLNQDLENAQAIAETEVRAGPFSREEAKRALADSLDTVARAFGKPSQAVPANVAKGLKLGGAETFAPLLSGLKDLELGVADDALQLLQAFVNAQPTPPYEWIADYRPLALERVRDLKLLAGLRGRIKGADTPEKQAALLVEFNQAKAHLETGGRMVELFDGSAGILRQQLDAGFKDEAGGVLAREAARNDADRDRWQAVRETAQSAIRLFRYDEALATLKGLKSLRAPDFIAARDALVARATRLAGFKRQLITDLNAGAGRDQPIPARNGTSYPQGIVRADMAGVRVATATGEVALGWTAVDPRALVRLAGRIADASAGTDPGAAAERCWLAATFAQEVGLTSEAHTLAEQAARGRPEYQAQLGLFE